MAQLIDILSWAAILGGSFFYLVGAVGLVRMPDVFTRMHATSVSETLGVGLLIIGMLLQAGFTLNGAKLVIIFIVLIYTGPIATHALARSALIAGVKPQLAEDRTRGKVTKGAGSDMPPKPKGGPKKPPARAKSSPRKKKR